MLSAQAVLADGILQVDILLIKDGRYAVPDICIQFPVCEQDSQTAAEGKLQGQGMVPFQFPPEAAAAGLPAQQQIPAHIMEKDRSPGTDLILPGPVIMADILVTVAAVNMQQVHRPVREQARRLIKTHAKAAGMDIRITGPLYLLIGFPDRFPVILPGEGVSLPGIHCRKDRIQSAVQNGLLEGKGGAAVKAAQLRDHGRADIADIVIGKAAVARPGREFQQVRIDRVAGKDRIMADPGVRTGPAYFCFTVPFPVQSQNPPFPG